MYGKIKNILNGVNLLIVEDDESLRESIKMSVENYVSEVYACANAKEALEVFEAKGVNLKTCLLYFLLHTVTTKTCLAR